MLVAGETWSTEPSLRSVFLYLDAVLANADFHALRLRFLTVDVEAEADDEQHKRADNEMESVSPCHADTPLHTGRGT